MPKLIISNVDNEYQVGEPWRLTPAMRQVSAFIAKRLVWLLESGDTLVLPHPVSPEFLRYATDLLGIDYDTVSIIVPPGAEKDVVLLTFDTISDPHFVMAIKAVVSGEESWTLEPYYFDRSIAWLTKQLAISFEPHQLAYFRQGGAEQLNSKVAFRRMAAGHGIPVSEGAICTSREELRVALEELIAITDAVIVKQDLNTGGLGNVVVAIGDKFERALGASQLIRVPRKADFCDIAERLWQQLTGPRNTQLVVEAYYNSATSFYTEFEISPYRRGVRLLNFGEMRTEPIWVGFEIPCFTLTTAQVAELAAVSMKLADLACFDGYVGKINCDAIRTQEGTILFTEINGRLGGCSHIHILAEHLLGPSYINAYTLLTRNDVKAGPFPELLKMLEREGILYASGSKRGVLILSEDALGTGCVEYMAVAPDRGEAHELEARALKVFEASRRAALSPESSEAVPP